MKSMDSNPHEDRPLVSLIIPAYNAEAFLARCLRSALSQDYPKVEIIVVDDGSTDSTPEIVASFSKQTNLLSWRIQNSGPSSARNYGMNKATGEFICFLDADDYLEAGYVSQLVRGLHLSTIIPSLVVTEYIDYSPQQPQGVPIRQLPREGQYSVKEFVPYLFEGTMGVLWGKLFSNQIIKSNQLQLNPDISFQEDLVFVFEYLKHCRSVQYLSATNYHYNRLNDQSLTTSLGLGHAEEFEKVQSALFKITTDPLEVDIIHHRATRFYNQLLYSIGWNSNSMTKAAQTIKSLDCNNFARKYSGKTLLKPYFKLLGHHLIFPALIYLRMVRGGKKILNR